MKDSVRRAFFAQLHNGRDNRKIPNMGVLTGDDILEMRRNNEYVGRNEYGNIFPREEVRRAREERRERPKYANNLNFTHIMKEV